MFPNGSVCQARSAKITTERPITRLSERGAASIFAGRQKAPCAGFIKVTLRFGVGKWGLTTRCGAPHLPTSDRLVDERGEGWPFLRPVSGDANGRPKPGRGMKRPAFVLHFPVRPTGPQLICDTITKSNNACVTVRRIGQPRPCGRTSGMSHPQLQSTDQTFGRHDQPMGDEPQTDKCRYMTMGVANRHQKEAIRSMDRSAENVSVSGVSTGRLSAYARQTRETGLNTPTGSRHGVQLPRKEGCK
jgi:hypothetical protein